MLKISANAATELWRAGIASYATYASRGRRLWKPYLWVSYLAQRLLVPLMRGGARIIVNAPPRHGKSEIVSHWLPTWYIERFPYKQIILASYGGEFAGEWGKKVRDEFAMNKYCCAKLRTDSRAVESWMTEDGGGMKTAGIGGPITGRGADLCVPGETLIDTKEGERYIADIRVGDFVLAFDHEKKEIVSRRVVATRKTDSSEFMRISTFAHRSFRVTPEHKFFNPEYGYVSAKSLRYGSPLISSVNYEDRARHVMYQRSRKPEPVYDIQVEGTNNFFAEGLLVHNCLIDDPHKNWEEAMSPIARERVIDWFNSTLYTRLEPNASIIVTQCMTGDTTVLLADGKEKLLRDIIVGDEVATYNNGRLEGSRINNHINHGCDLVFAIKTTSGIIVKANARHPFLAGRDGRLEWVRLKNLKPGDRLVGLEGGLGKGLSVESRVVKDQSSIKGCVTAIIPPGDTGKMQASASTSIPWVIGVNGSESFAKPKVVTSRPEVKDFANLTTTNGVGLRGLDPLVIMQRHGEAVISKIDMESHSSSMKQCLKNREDYVPFAGSLHQKKIPEPIGMENSVSIMSRGLNKFEDCCATIATSPSDTARPNEFCSPQLDTYKITLDTVAEIIESGYEEVFDIEVDRTGNFIANGLVSHNTRWHEMDLSGFLMDKHEDDWELIRFPALSEGEGDVLGREEGEALCPERFSKEKLENIKKVVGSHIFAGLYQQRPAPLLGGIVKRDWFRYWDELPKDPDEFIQTWDLTFKATGTSYAVGQVWYRKGANCYLIDQVRGKMDFLEQQRQLKVMWKRYPGALDKILEDAADAQAVKSALDATVPGIILQRASGSKEARLSAVAGAIESGNVYLPRKAEWLDDFLQEVTTFPGTVNDDQVDAMSLALDRLVQKSYDVNLGLPMEGVRQNPWESMNV